MNRFQWWQTERPDKPLHVTTGHYTEQLMRQETCIDVFPDVGKFKVGIKLGRDESTVNRLTTGWENTQRHVYAPRRGALQRLPDG